jgi:hypothetical protein
MHERNTEAMGSQDPVKGVRTSFKGGQEGERAGEGWDERGRYWGEAGVSESAIVFSAIDNAREQMMAETPNRLE